MEASYFDHAASNGCYVASAVGFDSIPAEFGCLYALEQHPGVFVGGGVYIYTYVE